MKFNTIILLLLLPIFSMNSANNFLLKNGFISVTGANEEQNSSLFAINCRPNIEWVEFYILPRAMESRYRLGEEALKTHSRTQVMRVTKDAKLFCYLSEIESHLEEVPEVKDIDRRMLVQIMSTNGSVSWLGMDSNYQIYFNSKVFKIDSSTNFEFMTFGYMPDDYGWK